MIENKSYCSKTKCWSLPQREHWFISSTASDESLQLQMCVSLREKHTGAIKNLTMLLSVSIT